MNKINTIALRYKTLIHTKNSKIIKKTKINVLALQKKLNNILPKPLGYYNKILIKAYNEVIEETKMDND